MLNIIYYISLTNKLLHGLEDLLRDIEHNVIFTQIIHNYNKKRGNCNYKENLTCERR